MTTGNLSHLNDFNRSVDLQTLCGYLPPENTYFVLQKDLRPEDAEYLESKLFWLKYILDGGGVW